MKEIQSDHNKYLLIYSEVNIWEKGFPHNRKWFLWIDTYSFVHKDIFMQLYHIYYLHIPSDLFFIFLFLLFTFILSKIFASTFMSKVHIYYESKENLRYTNELITHDISLNMMICNCIHYPANGHIKFHCI